MASTEMRIERISNPTALHPVEKSHSPLKKRSSDEEQTSSISRKRTREEEQTAPVMRKKARFEAQTASVLGKRKREEETELFPNKRRCMALPEEATQNVDFNRNVWSSAKPAQASEQQAVIGTHKAQPTPQFERVEKDPLIHMPKVGGYYIAQIVGQAYELHLVIQEKQLEVFKVTHSGVQKLRDDQIELVREQIKNQQIQANWSYWGNAIEYFGITANAAIGTGVLLSGNVPLGAQMIAGSALSLSGKLVRDFTDHSYKGAGLSLAGAVVSGYGVSSELATVFNNDLPQKLATSVTTFQKVSEVGVSYQQSKAQASHFSNRSKQVKNEFKRKTAEKEMEQIIGGLGKKDQANVIAAAAKTISVESQITGDIARGGKN
ncbi:MAG: hypothetical protein KFB93_05430 [Simkaniaceae bacterium]|nr:MAG: hypothetical protein KFB93_05430 [Simkaniaceae bacterium]